LAVAALAAALALAAPAGPATAVRPDPTVPPPLAEPLPAPVNELIEVTDFGANPTDLDMHLYVPDDVAKHPEILVAMHYCTGTGPAMFAGTDYASLADVYGFVVIYPTATREGHCFDVSSPAALTHGGGSDPAGIVSMVEYVQDVYGADRQRVYATGISSGAMMTSVLLGAYPDVFAAGSVMSGVPYGCFATTDGSEWNSRCATGQVDLTRAQWADLVASAYPEYRGKRPRVQLWHGSEDETLSFVNFREGVEQWTGVLGTRRTPAVVDRPRTGWTREAYTNRSGRVLVEAYTLHGAPHAVALTEPWLEQLTVEFLGLTQQGGRV
jgi:poly(hydroxyalkanoate) depolymerase family esterase